MAILTIYIESEEEKEALVKLIKETMALYVLVYNSNVRVADIIKEALIQYNNKLKYELQLKQK